MAARVDQGWRQSSAQALTVTLTCAEHTWVELRPQSPLLRAEMAFESYVMRHCLGQFADRRALTGGYGERRAACERGAAIMGVPALRDLSVDDLPRAQELLDDVTFRRVRHIVTENQRVLDTVQTLRAHGPRAIGGLLDASHASMRDDFEITVPHVDVAVEAALAAGAIGSRMTGGGFGGCVIALVPVDAVATVTDGVREAFASAGFTEPGIFTVRPVAGAGRIGPPRPTGAACPSDAIRTPLRVAAARWPWTWTPSGCTPPCWPGC